MPAGPVSFDFGGVCVWQGADRIERLRWLYARLARHPLERQPWIRGFTSDRSLQNFG